MTNLQAIDLLKGLEQSLDDYCELNDEGKTAFGMAITALELFGNSEQLPSAQPEKRTEERAETHACDLIERQAMNDDKMKIGDEVAFHWNDGRPDTVVVITHIGYDGFIDGMDAKGTLYASKNPQKWTKTGRYFPLVTHLLRQMSGDKLPSAQPTEASCWGCNCQKMERLKEQKTFSEMVHLHDAERREE